MNITQLKPREEGPQQWRAAHMRDLFEPWSLRKLQAKTGLGRTMLQQRFNGVTAFSLEDLELLAPLIRMTPAELATELLGIPNNPPETKDPRPGNPDGGTEPPTGLEPVTYSLQVEHLAPIIPINGAA